MNRGAPPSVLARDAAGRMVACDILSGLGAELTNNDPGA